jgi:hypothetical protein
VADEDDFSFDGDVGETEPKQDNNPVRELRKHANKLEKDLKASQAELEELRTFKAAIDQKTKAEQVGSIFTELGLNPAQAKLYELAMPDQEPSKEAVGKWAIEYGLASADEEPVPEATGFTPTTTPEGTPPGSKRLTGKEMLDAVFAGDVAGAQAAFLKGRVDTSDARKGLGPER